MLRLVVLLCLGAALAQDPCTDFQWHSPTTDSCLTFRDGWSDWVTWSKARGICQEDGGDLVKIVNEEMNDDIGYYMKYNYYKAPYWIGYHDDAEEGKWTWLDEAFGEPTNYTNWADDQPNNIVEFYPEGQNCAEIGFFSEFQWNDYECSAKAYFICETPV